MEYIIICLLVVVIGLLWYKEPTKMQNVVTASILKRLRENKESIANGVYDKLPKEAKEDIPEEAVKAGIGHMIDIAVEVIEEGIK